MPLPEPLRLILGRGSDGGAEEMDPVGGDAVESEDEVPLRLRAGENSGGGAAEIRDGLDSGGRPVTEGGHQEGAPPCRRRQAGEGGAGQRRREDEGVGVACLPGDVIPQGGAEAEAPQPGLFLPRRQSLTAGDAPPALDRLPCDEAGIDGETVHRHPPHGGQARGVVVLPGDVVTDAGRQDFDPVPPVGETPGDFLDLDFHPAVGDRFEPGGDEAEVE